MSAGPPSLDQLQSIIVVDCETTGLSQYDRIVSLAMIRISVPSLLQGNLDAGFVHLVFDPLRKSHPKAAEVHGWNDWTLLFQDRFSIWAGAISAYINKCDLMVAHNAKFDSSFLERELLAGIQSTELPPQYCTMETWRHEFDSGASLDSVARQIGLPPRGTHNALEDAWICLNVWMKLNGIQASVERPKNLTPFNFVPVPREITPNPGRNSAVLQNLKRATIHPIFGPNHRGEE